MDQLTERRMSREAAQLARTLSRQGSVVCRADRWPGTVAQWHSACGGASELLRRPVRSGTSTRGRTLWAVLADWPRTSDELVRAAARFRMLGGPHHQDRSPVPEQSRRPRASALRPALPAAGR